MSTWAENPTWTDPTTINDGQMFNENDGVTADDFNTIVSDLMYMGNYGTGTGDVTREEFTALEERVEQTERGIGQLRYDAEGYESRLNIAENKIEAQGNRISTNERDISELFQAVDLLTKELNSFVNVAEVGA